MKETSSLELIASIAHDLPVAVWVAHAPGGEFVYANRMFAEIMGTGARSDVAVGSYAQPYGIHDRSGALLSEDRMPFVQVVRTGTTFETDEIVIHRPDGLNRNVRARAKPLFDASGKIEYVVITFTDITREVEAERGRAEGENRLHHAQKMESIANLAGGVAHDFNNLLASIKILTSLLTVDERDPIRLDHLHRIDESANSAVQLTRSLLWFARRVPQLSEPVDLAVALRGVVDVFERIHQTIALDVSLSPAPVLGDKSRLEQILFNLLINARDALPSGGRISVRTGVAGGKAFLEVADDGPGIALELRDRVFEPYFGNGTSGLGLAMVYGIVQAHGGTIEARSAEPHGTIMCITLPLAAPIPASTPGRESPPAASRARGLLLLAEDEPDVRHATRLALQRLGYDVLEAENGIEAEELLASHAEVAGVLLDQMMPRRSGSATFHALRKIRPDLPIVLTSGFVLNEEAEELLAQGATAFLEKPYDLKSLRAVLSGVFAPAD